MEHAPIHPELRHLYHRLQLQSHHLRKLAHRAQNIRMVQPAGHGSIHAILHLWHPARPRKRARKRLRRTRFGKILLLDVVPRKLADAPFRLYCNSPFCARRNGRDLVLPPFAPVAPKQTVALHHGIHRLEGESINAFQIACMHHLTAGNRNALPRAPSVEYVHRRKTTVHSYIHASVYSMPISSHPTRETSALPGSR